jgi:tetratricopeptide (TPR) repeat protein
MERFVLRNKMLCHVVESCNKELLKEPNNIAILKTRGIALNIAQKYNEAINDFVKVLKALPDDFSSYYLKSDCHYQLGEFIKAKQDFMRAALLEDNPNIERSYIENILVPEETELKEVEKILEYERNKAILKIFPDIADTKEN